MTDREEAIEILEEHLDHCKEQDEDEKLINALNFAIESLKVDMTYDLAYEKVESEDKNEMSVSDKSNS